MKMFIHSSYGLLDCTEMTLQAIEDSIPDQVSIGANKDIEATKTLTEACEVSPELATEQTTPNIL